MFNSVSDLFSLLDHLSYPIKYLYRKNILNLGKYKAIQLVKAYIKLSSLLRKHIFVITFYKAKTLSQNFGHDLPSSFS